MDQSIKFIRTTNRNYLESFKHSLKGETRTIVLSDNDGDLQLRLNYELSEKENAEFVKNAMLLTGLVTDKVEPLRTSPSKMIRNQASAFSNTHKMEIKFSKFAPDKKFAKIYKEFETLLKKSGFLSK